jgi:hypothetical protein
VSRTKILLLLLALPILAPAQRHRLDDSSDWWSLIRREEFPAEIRNIPPRNKPIDAANFEIVGVAIGENQFANLARKFGIAEEIERGDAASGRHQVCYQSSTGITPVHLIFEFGEVEGIFYLFKGGADWKGSEACAKSKLVNENLSSRSGLRLGLTRSEVEAILGPPDAVSGQSVSYKREVRRRTTQTEFDRLRKDYPSKLSDQAAHEQFDFVDEGSEIEIRFQISRVVYIAVSRDVV